MNPQDTKVTQRTPEKRKQNNYFSADDKDTGVE